MGQNGRRRGIRELADFFKQLAWLENTVAGILILTSDF